MLDVLPDGVFFKYVYPARGFGTIDTIRAIVGDHPSTKHLIGRTGIVCPIGRGTYYKMHQTLYPLEKYREHNKEEYLQCRYIAAHISYTILNKAEQPCRLIFGPTLTGNAVSKLQFDSGSYLGYWLL